MNLPEFNEFGLPNLMTSKELAEYLDLPETAIKDGRKHGHSLFRLGFLIGGSRAGLRFKVADVNAYITAAAEAGEA